MTLLNVVKVLMIFVACSRFLSEVVNHKQVKPREYDAFVGLFVFALTLVAYHVIGVLSFSP